MADEKVHKFPMQLSDGRVGVSRIPHSKMKRCPCGCDRFVQQFHVGFGKPMEELGAPLMQIHAPVFVCAECGKELLPTHPAVGDKPLIGG